MTSQDRQKIKRIYNQVSLYVESLQQIRERQTEIRDIDSSIDFVPEFLDEALVHLSKCRDCLEEIVNS